MKKPSEGNLSCSANEVIIWLQVTHHRQLNKNEKGWCILVSKCNKQLGWYAIPRKNRTVNVFNIFTNTVKVK